MTRILFLAPAPTSAASTRFRLEQFFPALRQAGFDPILRPFLDEEGFAALYSRGHIGQKALAAAQALAGRAVDLARALRAAAVVVHREAALVGPPLVEWFLARALGRPLIFDLDDAVWVPYVSPTYGALLSRLLKAPQKTFFTLAAARRVIAGNHYLAEEARRFNHDVEVIPTVVDTDQFRPTPRDNPAPVIGWVGSHSTGQYLRTLAPALQKLAQRRRFVMRAIGAPLFAPGVTVENRPWTLDGEIGEFQSLDVGLYPLVEDAWSRGKSGFKAVQYMACGVPVVASPVGVTTDMIRDGHNGFLARSEDEWVTRLEQLLDDAALRKRMGEAGRAEAEKRWSLRAHAPRFVSVIEGAAR
jgi:glycosyltransferase involved in cell wall biosynthesis